MVGRVAQGEADIAASVASNRSWLFETRRYANPGQGCLEAVLDGVVGSG